MRERGLKIDRNDLRSLRHGRDRDIGYSFESEFYQPMPMFFTSEGNGLPGLIGNYRGSHAFLVCGGPSFGDLDHSLLDNCFTMSLNNSAKTYRTDAWACVDDPARFMKSIWLDPKMMKFVPLDHAEKPLWNNTEDGWGPLNKKVRECPNVIYYRRNEKFEASRWLFEYTFNWGDHSKWGGGRSVMLAALKLLFTLGFRHVYLLGCDLNMNESVKYHFDEERDRGAQKGNMSTYKKMINTYFPALKPQFDYYGYNVYNCNPDSRLTVFPHMPFEEAVRNATDNLDIDTEISNGMYKKYEDKMRNLVSKKKEFRNKNQK